MDEYISKNTIIDALEEENERQPFQPTSIYSCIIPFIRQLPATDIQPVKRGRWIDCTFYDPHEKSWEQDYEFKCSNCGHKIFNEPNDDNLFCGHCGARMYLEGGDSNG